MGIGCATSLTHTHTHPTPFPLTVIPLPLSNQAMTLSSRGDSLGERESSTLCVIHRLLSLVSVSACFPGVLFGSQCLPPIVFLFLSLRLHGCPCVSASRCPSMGVFDPISVFLALYPYLYPSRPFQGLSPCL